MLPTHAAVLVNTRKEGKEGILTERTNDPHVQYAYNADSRLSRYCTSTQRVISGGGAVTGIGRAKLLGTGAIIK